MICSGTNALAASTLIPVAEGRDKNFAAKERKGHRARSIAPHIGSVILGLGGSGLVEAAQK